MQEDAIPATSGCSSRVVSARSVLTRLRAFYDSQKTRSLDFRKEQLCALGCAIEVRESDILEALYEDLHKPRQEAYVSEVGFVLSDISYTLQRLARWARPRRRRGPLLAWPSRGLILPEPYGTVLIIGPWNYPFQLLLSPLVAAIAAGNCVCLKPSELAPATSAVVARMVLDTFSEDYITAAEGGPETAEELTNQGFDYIFFTGSIRVGRQVMEAAARHLTPVTLELGGKSPCIVCHDVDLTLAARRILWGKCMNAGQTCMAPDYVWVDALVEREFLTALGSVLNEFYGGAPRQSPDYGRIINRGHFDRLLGYLGQGRLVCGGEHEADGLFMAPTILADVSPSAPVMQEEIFGPILPVLRFNDIDEVLVSLKRRPKPLALYVFARNRAFQARILAETASGGVCVNDTMTQAFGKTLPFGGLGASGMGSYHGKAGFDCFTHYKSVLRRSTWPDLRFRYPPTRHSLATVKRFCRLFMRR